MGKPEIRFKGYTDEWEQRKLGDVAEFSKGSGYSKGDLIESGTPIILYGRLYTKYETIISDVDTFVEAKDGSVYSKGGEVIVPASGETAEDIARAASVDKSGILLGGDLNVVMPNEDINSAFLAISISNGSSQRELARKAQGKSVVHIHNEEIRNLIVPFPTKTEQNKIENYFADLDHLITLHQRKCAEIKSLKKYMLQKMFPQNEQKVPEIRFEGFTEAWEQRKLDDWGDFYYGRSCPKWSVTEDATIPCIRYGELYTKFGAKIDRVYSYTNMPPENLRFSKGTEVLIPRVGEDPMDYNHCTWLSMQDVAIGEMISVFNTDNNPLFTATMFNATLQNEFAMRVEGGSVTNLYFEKLKNIEVSFPSIPEQEKIASYFENLDNLITLHQQKCEELKKIKKFMLQKMFV